MEEQPKPPEVKAVVAFGTKAARAGTTPKALKFFYQGLGILSAIWVFIIEPNLSMNLATAHIIDKVLLGSNTAIYHICHQFGWVLSNNTSTEV